jgi:hypothetical protein
MENENKKKLDFFEIAKNTIKHKKKLLIIFLLFIFMIPVGIFYFEYRKENQNKTISEKYIIAGIYLASKENLKSKEIYKEIIFKKHNFYSLLALSSILENNLIKNHDELIELFEVVENINLEKNQLDLIKLKKSLYLLKISKKEQGKKLLDEIISDNSKWKDIALELSK